MQDRKAGKISLDQTAAREAIIDGITEMYNGVTTTFGPRGQNVSIEKNYGFPQLTRDGVTVAKDIYFSKRPKNQGAQYAYQASEATNRIAGDGTTASVALLYHLFVNGINAIRSGTHPMVVKETLLKDSALLLARLKELSKDVKPEQLRQVATVSSGDPVIGELIADAIAYVGPNGGINAEKAAIDTIECEYVDGYFLQSGFTALQDGKKELLEPMVIVLQKRVASAVDMGDILTRAIAAKKLESGRDPLKFFIVGNIDATAYTHTVSLINKSVIDAIIIKTPPHYGEMGNALLEDIAIYAGCEPILESTNLRDITTDYVGSINRVVANKLECTLYGEHTGENVIDRIAALKAQIDTEAVDAIREKIQDRLAKLEGKIAIFHVGAPTETAKEEIEYRVEDSILATKAAVKHGVVPGGCSTLIELSKIPELSPISREALQSVFKKLLTNANLPEQVKLVEILAAKPGFGFNLRESDQLVDLTKAGILDATLVIEQIIKNSCQMAADLLTIGCMIVNEEKDTSK